MMGVWKGMSRGAGAAMAGESVLAANEGWAVFWHKCLAMYSAASVIKASVVIRAVECPSSDDSFVPKKLLALELNNA
jgi:hypothetical protein